MERLIETGKALVRSWWPEGGYRKLTSEEVAFIDALNGLPPV